MAEEKEAAAGPARADPPAGGKEEEEETPPAARGPRGFRKTFTLVYATASMPDGLHLLGCSKCPRGLPWDRILTRADMGHFHDACSGRFVIVGCNTAKRFTRPFRDSLGTIAVCGHPEHWLDPPPGFHRASSLSEALDLAYELGAKRGLDRGAVRLVRPPVVAGGARLIEESLQRRDCARVYHTAISPRAVVCRHENDSLAHARVPGPHRRWERGCVVRRPYLSIWELRPRSLPEGPSAVPAE